MHPEIPITKPVFGKEEKMAVQQPLESGWVVQGPMVEEFEQQFLRHTGSDYAIATSSCTAALHISVTALGLKPNDEVIVPAFTWLATANAVEFMGARPIFCDIDLETFNIDPNQIERLLSPRTVGIIPVHLFGLCADMEAILDVAKANDLWIIEDAACAFGSWHRGQHAGTFGEMGCFSFHPRKSITTGEGGMIITGSSKHNRLARSLRNHGASCCNDDRPEKNTGLLLSEYHRPGYNYRMTDLQGAIGCEQMKRADFILGKRRECAQHYNDLLSDIEWLQRPTHPKEEHGYQSYVCLFRPESPTMQNIVKLHKGRNALMTHLHEAGISTRQGTHAPFIQAYYTQKYNLQPSDLPSAYMADRLSIALPIYPQMTATDRERVFQSLKEFE